MFAGIHSRVGRNRNTLLRAGITALLARSATANSATPLTSGKVGHEPLMQVGPREQPLDYERLLRSAAATGRNKSIVRIPPAESNGSLLFRDSRSPPTDVNANAGLWVRVASR